MEFFERDTEHIRYLNTLSGRYTYCSKILSVTIIAVFLCSSIIMAKLGISKESKGILDGVYVLLMFVACYIPCRYKADENGFTIVSGLVSRYFSYDEVISVIAENRVFRYHRSGKALYENVLTVSTAKGMYRFHERCGIGEKAKARHIELIRLKEFINKNIK